MFLPRMYHFFRSFVGFIFFNPQKESSYDYTRNIPLKKGQCLVSITEITAVEMGEEENAKSHQWWTKAACETGLETGSTASSGTWKAKQNPEAPVLQLVHTRLNHWSVTVLHPSCTTLHLSTVPQQMQHGYLLSPCFPPVSCIWFIFHDFNIQAWSACSGVWVIHLVTCPDHVLHICCQVASECSAMMSNWHHCFASWALCKLCWDLTS